CRSVPYVSLPHPGATSLPCAPAAFAHGIKQQNALISGITSSTCGLDIACACQDDEFLSLLQTKITTGCSRADQDATLAAASRLCTAAVPSLLDNRGGGLVATITILLIIAILAVVLRLWARKISRVRLGADDYWIIVSLVCSSVPVIGKCPDIWKILVFGLDATSYCAIDAGAGRHVAALTLAQVQGVIKADQATQVLFGSSITATKLSILYFYHRLFPSRTFYLLSMITGIASVLWWVGLMLTAFLHCQPFEYYWDRSIPGGHCVDDLLVGYTLTSVNIGTDLIVLILPIPWLLGMNMAVPKRLAVVGLFVLGSLYVTILPTPLRHLNQVTSTTVASSHASLLTRYDLSVCIAGIVRLPLLSELQISDITWSSISVGLWINVECNIGILSACLPILRPLFSTKYPTSPIARLNVLIRRWAGSISGSSSNNGNGNGYGSSNDMEKGGALSDPNSDSTAVEEVPKWPSEVWKWSRNNSDASTQNNNARSSPVVGARDPGALPTARPRGFDEEEKRRRKVATWYTAAADMLPEMDMERLDRRDICVAEIPRYRDDGAKSKDVALAPPVTEYVASPEEVDNHNGNEQKQGVGDRELRRTSSSSSEDDWFAVSPATPTIPPPPPATTTTQTAHQPSQRNSLGVPVTVKSNAPSARSSWGMRRDVWNLMPSVVLWDRDSLAPSTIHNIR
ncbi:MAG: hypothetical protein Q9174_006145, partial [Haloplaca sp. 1 TL-2023]